MSQLHDESLVGLLADAVEAYAQGDIHRQARSASEALKIAPDSPDAALLHFLAYWQGGNPGFASFTLLNFVKRNGAHGLLLQCTLFANLELSNDVLEIVGNAEAVLASLPAADVRAQFMREIPSEMLVRKNALLATRSERAGSSIIDVFGPAAHVKSMSPVEVEQRWRLPTYHVVKNISIVPRAWYLFDDKAIYLNETQSWPQILTRPRLLQPPTSANIVAASEKQVLLNVAKRRRRVGGPCLLIGSCPNIYFWLVNHVARFCGIEGQYDYRSIPLLVDEELADIHRDSFAELGIAEDQLVRCARDEVIDCDELIVPTMLATIDVVHPAAVQWLRQKFGSRARDKSYPDRLFITRTKPHRRRFLNEDEVFERLSAHGFRKLAPDNMSFHDQNMLFQNAAIVVGPYGTCLTGIMFAPPGCATFELIDDVSMPVHRFNENVALQVGQRFACIPTELRPPEGDWTSAQVPFVVDPELVLRQVLPHLV